MSENLPCSNESETPESRVYVGTDEFAGVGRMVGETGSMRTWEVVIRHYARVVCTFPVTCYGDSTDDTARVQQRICQAIDQFTYDPMSMA